MLSFWMVLDAWAQASHSITLNSAIINGQDITTQRMIVVDPGQSLSGRIEVAAHHGNGPQEVVPVAATPNWRWGDFASNAQIFTELDPKMSQETQAYAYVLPDGLTAPDIPGTYYIGIFNGSVQSTEQLLSCDGFPLLAPPVYFWDEEALGLPTAPDVASWPMDFWEQAMTGEHVEGFPLCQEDGCGNGYYGGAAIRVIVLDVMDIEPEADTFISSSTRLTWVGSRRVMERYVNYGTNGGLSVIRGINGFGGSFLDWRGTLIRFDLSDIPESAQVEEAELFLYHYSVWGELISIHRMTKEWSEREATWYQPCQNCELWWAGWDEGNYVKGPTDTQRITGIDQWFSWDVTADVQSFMEGTPNYGWFLKSAEVRGSDWTSASFYSKDVIHGEWVPYLRVRLYVPPPEVTFMADPETIPAGGLSTLTWTTAHAENVAITPGIGSVALKGFMIVSPSVTTTYTLTATGRGGTTSKSVTVVVTSTPPEVTLTAVPDSIQFGESSTLSWSSTNAVSATLDPGIGEVPVSGSIEVFPTETTTYTIEVTGPGGSASASATVTVIYPSPTVTISADPSTILPGQSSTLTWSSTYADTCVLEPDVGAVAINGSVSVSPRRTTTYTMTATGSGGTATAQVEITVIR